jgi:hypothetical protein
MKKEDDMFFGTSPKLKKALRKTTDNKKIDLDEMEDKQRAIELDKEGTAKVGKVVKLIDLAMGDDEFKPKKAKGWIKIDDLGLKVMPKKRKP